MKIALLLHLYQPVTQSEEVFRRVYAESYSPLLKKIAKAKDFRVSLDLSLSLLEQMDRYGYSEWFADLKELIKLEKVEIVGSAAYHPLLSKLPKNIIEKEIILNEYGLGYYLGSHESLEGDPSILIKNLSGFFPPEVAVSERVLSIVDDLGYKWMIIDESTIPFDLNYQHKHGVYQFKDYSAKLVCRNRSFSNMLSFKRDLNVEEIIDSLKFFQANERSFAVVMDGEFFGHHYADGFLVFDKLLEAGKTLGVTFCTVSEYVEDDNCLLLKELLESTWGASDEDMSSNNPYPMWCDPNNDIHRKQWELIDTILGSYSHEAFMTEVEEYTTLPVWKTEGLSQISNTVLRGKVARDILLLKSLHSDQFWWASKKTLPAGEFLFDAAMIKKSLKVLESYVELYLPQELLGVQGKINEIKGLLN